MSDSSQTTLIWKQAIKRYEEITKKQLDNTALKNLKTVDDLLQQIDSENQSFSDFRRKRHDIFRAMTFALRPIELVGDLAAGGASIAFPPSSLVFGAVQFLINAVKGVSAKYDAIIELMSTLKARIFLPPSLFLPPLCQWNKHPRKPGFLENFRNSLLTLFH
jgi:hypothetical protein